LPAGCDRFRVLVEKKQDMQLLVRIDMLGMNEIAHCIIYEIRICSACEFIRSLVAKRLKVIKVQVCRDEMSCLNYAGKSRKE